MQVLLDYRITNYQNNWDFIVFHYKNCMNEYANAIDAMEASNNLMTLELTLNQQHNIQLKDFAMEEIKKSFDKILNAENKCQ